MTEGEVKENTENFGYAGFWRRVGACFIDWFIFLPFYIAIVWAKLHYISRFFVDASSSDQQITPHSFIALDTGAIMFLIWLLYHATLESRWKQASIGKIVAGIKVTDYGGNKISFSLALARNVSSILSHITLFIGFIIAGLTQKKQALHDIICSCVVVRYRRNSLFWPLFFISAAVIMFSIALGLYYMKEIKLPDWKTGVKNYVIGEIDKAESLAKQARDETSPDADIHVDVVPANPFDERPPGTEKTYPVEEVRLPFKATEEDYERLLNNEKIVMGERLDDFPVINMGSFALVLSNFFQSDKSPSIWLEVYASPLLNLDRGGFAKVMVSKVLNGMGENIYDAQSSLEKEFFHKVNMSSYDKNSQGIRTVRLISGVKDGDVKAIEGNLILHMPIGVEVMQFAATDIGIDKITASGNRIALKKMEAGKVQIEFEGDRELLLDMVAYNSEAKPLERGSSSQALLNNTITVNYQVEGNPSYIQVVVAGNFYEKEYPFFVGEQPSTEAPSQPETPPVQ